MVLRTLSLLPVIYPDTVMNGYSGAARLNDTMCLASLFLFLLQVALAWIHPTDLCACRWGNLCRVVLHIVGCCLQGWGA